MIRLVSYRISYASLIIMGLPIYLTLHILDLRMLKVAFLIFLLTSKSKSDLLDEIEPVHHEVLLAYFSNPVLQVGKYAYLH